MERHDGSKPREREKTHELRSFTYEYATRSGEKICGVKADVAQSAEDGTRVLRSLVLEKDGKSVDLFSVIGIGDGDRVVVGSPRHAYTAESMIDKNSLVITAPLPETPFDIGMLLHEAGHLAQLRAPEFAALSELYDRAEGQKSHKDVESLRTTLRGIWDALPEKRSPQANHVIAFYDNFPTDVDVRPDADDVIDAFYSKLQDPDTQAMLRSVKRAFEHDATSRAFVWLKALRDDYGIDFFQELSVSEDERLALEQEQKLISKSGSSYTDVALRSVAHMLATGGYRIVERLNNALASHGADPVDVAL